MGQRGKRLVQPVGYARGVLPYITYTDMCRPIGFCTVLVWNRVLVFERITGVYERIYRFNSKCIRKKEKYANSKKI